MVDTKETRYQEGIAMKERPGTTRWMEAVALCEGGSQKRDRREEGVVCRQVHRVTAWDCCVTENANCVFSLHSFHSLPSYLNEKANLQGMSLQEVEAKQSRIPCLRIWASA